MKYNFDEIVDRSNNFAAKTKEAYKHYGTNDVIPLWIADMDFKTLPDIVESIKQRAEQGIFGYTYRPDEYFKAIANWQEKRNGYLPDVNKMAFAPGVVPCMRMIVNMFTADDAKIIIQQPVYHPFVDVVENTGRELLISNLKVDENYNYTMDYEDFENQVKGGDVSYFILCNPHNPVGRAWTKEELLKIGNICVKYNVQIISDEIHSDLILNGNKHTVMSSVSKEIEAITTTCIAPSKTFNLAGLQSSTVIFNTTQAKDKYLQELGYMDIARNNCFSLVATMTAYEKGEEWVNQLNEYIYSNMKFIKEYCDTNIPQIKTYIPEATYLMWVDVRGLNLTDEELLKFTVEKAKVAFGKGVSFGNGGSGFIRINTACPKSILEKALNQLKKAVDSLNLN